MMSTEILQPGEVFPQLTVSTLEHGALNIGKPNSGYDWKMVIIYRGKHCPLCTKYLNELNQLLPEFNKHGVDVIAVSADSEENAREHTNEINPSFPVAYDLSIEQMQELGLFISESRLGMDAQRPFAEPGLFIINEEGHVQILDISNVPFARPNLNSMLMGINFLRGLTEKFPINGTYATNLNEET